MKKNGEILVGSALLTIALLSHSVVLLVFEPTMGFREFSDFFDLEKIIPALGSTAWYVGNVMHVLVGFGLLLIASGMHKASIPRPVLTAAFGFAAAPLFVVVGMSGFVGDQLLTHLTDSGQRDAALLGLVFGSRTMVLYAAVALFGGMVLAMSAQSDCVPRWMRILGVPVGMAALLFVIVPTPVPLILFVWSAGLLFSMSMTRQKPSLGSEP
jgi:hypothetical protein